ncbi:hypothetical protein [Rhizobium sp. JAB6]|uniref:hypothetical protein n=1 Tax=Rhizobium sp. JAB6 TaxID=2127050 RepID=UPI0011B1FC71|nr:hypothetical protein [Rhizobium sp. JAB6]
MFFIIEKHKPIIAVYKANSDVYLKRCLTGRRHLVMMDSMALAKAIELQSLAREEQWRRNEDLFYLDYGFEPPRLFIWIGRIFAVLNTRRKAMKKADRPETGRSACNGNDSCGQAAACSRM